MASVSPKLILHAPNIHTGGGFVLLQALLAIKPFPFAFVQLDERLRATIQLPSGVTPLFVKRSWFARLLAEWRIKKNCRKGDTILCFNGLPPLFPVLGKAIVFLQNRLIFEKDKTVQFSFWPRIRFFLERRWIHYFQKHASQFIVQSPSMRQLVQRQLQPCIPLSLFPFHALATIEQDQTDSQQEFLYIASGEVHKNHQRLVDAWVLLAAENIKPSLVLTIDPNTYPDLWQRIALQSEQFDLNIVNLGSVPFEQTGLLYKKARAFIYPSLLESFGLPLLEAKAHNLPILASERDYVRDVIHPVETFDPTSALSIARAIKRFLKLEAEVFEVYTAQEFIAEIHP